MKKEESLIKILKEALPAIPKREKEKAIKELNSFLKNHGVGILILSTYDKNGNADLKLSIIRTHENHSKETFKKLFEEFPQLKEDVIEIFEEEAQKDKRENKTLSGVC